MNGRYVSKGEGMYVPQQRKAKSLFNWLANIIGVDACWIEGIDEHNQPIWALAKRLSRTCWYLVSKKVKAVAGVAMLGGVLLLPADSLHAQTGINLSNLTGVNGFTLNGVDPNDRSGSSIASGDINGDGIDDLIIGAKHADPNNWESGETYVVFGQSNSTNFSSIELSSLDGNTGFVLNGIDSFGESGYSVASGDVNGDEIDDVIIGANRADAQAGANSQAGETYVVFGKSTAFTSIVELSSLDGGTGFVLHGIDSGDKSGTAVASGDINGDGKDDLIIGADGADPNGKNNAGETYVVFGFDNPTTDIVDLSSLDGNTGFIFKGINGLERNGRAVSSGDINGDGTDDVIIGAYGASPNGGWSGETYVVFGKSTTFDSVLERSILDGSTGFVLHGISGGDQSGRAVASGDINGDGRDDVVIGARFADPNGTQIAGETYVVFGKTTGFDSVLELSSLDGSTGFVLPGIDANSRSGNAVASGDINGDGKEDVVIGAFGTYDIWPNGWNGETYVVFGFDDATIDTVNLASLDGTTGFALKGIDARDFSGGAVASGDINGDGKEDVIIGASNANPNGKDLAGETYVFTQFPAATELLGNEGFRMLVAPASGTILDEFLEPLWTQGMTGADTPNGGSNLWIWDETLNTNSDIADAGDWIPVTDLTSQNVTCGQGFLMYMFADDNNDGNTEGFPKMLNTIDIFNSAVVDTGTVTLVNDLDHGRFFLVGNPFSFTVDWVSSGITRTNMSNTIYVWDDVNSQYLTWNGITGDPSAGKITPYQSFFVQGFGNGGSMSIGESTVSGSAGVQPKQVQAQHKAIKIHAEAGEFSAEAWLSFQEGGELERDKYDGLYLKPFASEFLKLGTIISSEEVLQINALPVDQQEQLVIPLDLSGTIEETLATLKFTGLDAFDGWKFFIRDTHTGQEFFIDDASLELEIEPIRAKLQQLQLPAPVPMKAKAAESRYQIVVTPATSASNEPDPGIPSRTELEQNYPNPFNPSTTIEFGVPAQGDVRLEVFDLLGRKVAELLNEPMQPGWYSVNFDASALSSGVYLYRLQTGSTSLIQKMTLIK